MAFWTFSLSSGIKSSNLVRWLASVSVQPCRERYPKDRASGQIRYNCDRTQRICHRYATNLTSQFPILVSIARGRGVVDVGGQDLLESESPVTGGIGVPVGERCEPALEPWALDDVTGERRGRHFESRVSQLTWVW